MEPNWKPLECRLGRGRCVGFMYMGRVNGINLYKHGITRTYLSLDDDGTCYVQGVRGCFVQADFDVELKKLEKVLQSLKATLETPYDETFIARKREALRQQGVSMLTVQIEPEDALVH